MQIPRARQVGQSWLTSPFTSIQCLIGSLRALLTKPIPDAVFHSITQLIQGVVQWARNMCSGMSCRSHSKGISLLCISVLMSVFGPQMCTDHLRRVVRESDSTLLIRENTSILGRSFLCTMARAWKKIPKSRLCWNISLSELELI